ncbi:hypothetical protein IHE55_12935 [Streptomyces pactum]|uniref:Secreted protein n=1 Tax=Streptomyces pactum TaxID=68249 RepID=A0ABS0NKD2_9ACTN|nr:hypothetical protein [Streptomyces pactum]MBH5335653.1 hypothetical protein [Streptomyces pactum]
MGRTLFTAVALFLGVFLAVEYTAANCPRPTAVAERFTARAATVAETETLRTVPYPVPLHTGEENVEGRRAGPAPATAPAPHGKSGCVCDCDALITRDPVAITKPSLKHHAVPVSRSGQLAIEHQIFRC